YEEDDYPNRLPIHLAPVALTYEVTERYGVSNLNAWNEWRSTDAFSNANGFVRLGPKGRLFSVSMLHQMHCLQIVRGAIIRCDADVHVHHWLNMLRQGILCSADSTLDPLYYAVDGTPVGAAGIGIKHVCRDWEAIYRFVRENQLTKAWNASH
ncbi:uncharacterized protein STEHIDRAFT_56128, partial [Stereum hirsutum FP-91666 SS1]|uniref:uncharacterized protein n=1 Tax=Stereum hirsutum (strain FP-91666) TaxID=721885 RepID=UPI000440AB98